MTDINPYQILGVPIDATLEEVKEAYRVLAQKHHPDKPGGNPEKFKIIKLSFKMIADNLKKGTHIPKSTSNTYGDMKSAAQNLPPVKYQSPQEFFGSSGDVNPNKNFGTIAFNEKFMQQVKEDDDTLAGTNTEDYRENRTKEQLLSEQRAINDEMSNIKPIFEEKTFDRNVFNRMFEHFNGTPEGKSKDIQTYEEPIALTSGLQPYTEIDDNQKTKQTDKLSSLGFGEISQVFGQKIPQQLDREMMSQFSKQPDITDVNTIESDYHSKMKQRLNDYNATQIVFHPKPENPSQLPDQLRANNDPIIKLTQQSMSDAYSRKLQERNNLYAPSMQQQQQQQPRQQPQLQMGNGQQHKALPIMDYPQNSNLGAATTSVQQDDYFVKIPQQPAFQQRGKTYMPQAQAQPQPYLQPYLQPQLQTQPQANIEQIQQQLQQLQQTVQKQNKIIKKLNRK
jgi:curved DNA-binding protein CbpA